MNGDQGRRGQAVLVEVPLDGLGAGVPTAFTELLAPRDDGVFDLGRGLLRSGLGSGLLWLERRLATFAVELHVAMDPGLRTSGRGGHRAHRPLFHQHCGHCVFGQIHGHLRERKCPRNSDTCCPRNYGTSDRLAHQLRSSWTAAPLTTRTVPMHHRLRNQPTTRDRLMTRVRK